MDPLTNLFYISLFRIRNLDPDFTEIQAQFRAAIYALRSTVSDIKPIPEGCKCVPILEVKNLESDAYEGAVSLFILFNLSLLTLI